MKAECGDVQQMAVKEQTIYEQGAPLRKRCKRKSGGRNVHAPSMLQMNPALPSLGIYRTMIRTPEKNPVQETCEYEMARNKEHESHEEISEKEEGEIDESHSDIQVHSPDDIQNYEEGSESDGNEIDDKEEDGDSEMDLSETNQEAIEQESISSDDEDTNCPEFDLSLEKIVQIPPEMLIPLEKVKEELGSEDKALNQIENANKQINALKEMIRKHIEESREKDNEDHDMVSGDISQPTTAAAHRKVIMVQPIASYDEIFSTSHQPTEGELVENLIEVKKEPGTVENDDDLIFVDHEYPNVDMQIKSEPTELETAKQHPSKKRTIVLKSILKALKQPEPQSIVQTVSTSTLPKMVVDMKGKSCTTGKPGIKLVASGKVQSEHANVPTMSLTPKATISGKAVCEVKSSTTEKSCMRVVDSGKKQSEHRNVPKIFLLPKAESSTNPVIKIVDITRESKLKKQEETVEIHTMKLDKVAMPTIQKHEIVKPKARAPVQIKVHGNIDKQMTIQGNVKNLTIHHVTTPSVTSQSYPAIAVTSPSELTVHVPSVQVRTQSQLAMEYKSRERMKGKQIVEVQRNVNKGNIEPPVPVSEQSDDYYYYDKSPKKFKSKSYYCIDMTRLCDALENPQVLVCKTCGKLFKHEKNYRNHLGVHDGVKRFACQRCGQKFLQESELMKHRNMCRVSH